MKMAKASQDDLELGLPITSAIEACERGIMPAGLCEDKEEMADFGMTLRDYFAANAAAILALIAERDELTAKLDRAQAEIRALESKLLDETTKPIRTCEACAIYPCKCE